MRLKLDSTFFAQRGSKAYADYHNGIYATGLNEGKLTTTVIEKKAILAGLDISKFKATDVYVKNLQLFSQLGFRGTPAFIIMPTDNVTLDNIFIVNGADENSVREAIKTLSK